MFLDLVDVLRCTREHADTPLVAAVTRRDALGAMAQGTLGCPICYRQYPVVDGVAWFDVLPATAAGDVPEGEGEPEAAMRAGAFLGASEGATLILEGAWSAGAETLAELLPLRIYVVNPATRITESERIAVIRAGERLPFSAGSVRGIALSGAALAPSDLAHAARLLQPRGRLVAPVTAEVPASLAEIARDERYWVAESAPPLVPLRRA